VEIDSHVLLFWGILLPRFSLAGENYDLSLSNLHSDRIRTSLGGDDDPPERTRGYDPMAREVCELSVPCSLSVVCYLDLYATNLSHLCSISLSHKRDALCHFP